ncbi:cilia- and flagella-associated protein 58 [Parasteatoda tepidariorum]|uniref:cilia- and flagella-associated protein 58 n=1 Tax=Parasteatoda tepidariorum TaxID=114398 RepID=UPI00077FC48F|nr:cilia- and flagella-associated protein 58 [Parasteatoda tepidariorum]XP_015907392.1 cilia- and flagella-associated protein 58 [Parasteatoda tepidariorum]XP_015907393.1 cilia- and flagella-associated protein 58 [Parasteatoda tepidariorum]
MKNLLKNLAAVTVTFKMAFDEIKKNKIMNTFEKEFNEVVDILEKASESHQKLLNQIQELTAKLAINEANLFEANAECCEKEKTHATIKQDLIKACKCIEDLKEKETKYKETIQKLDEQISNLIAERDNAIPEKEKAFELEAERERKLLNSRISQLENDLKVKEDTEIEIKNKLMETMDAMQKLESNVESLRLKLKQELERNQNVVKDRHFAEKNIRDNKDRVQELEDVVHSLKNKLEETSRKMNSYEAKVVSHQKKINGLRSFYQKAKAQTMIQINSYKDISAEKDKLSILIERKEEDLKTLNGKLVNIINEKEQLLQKQLTLQTQKQNLESSNDQLKKELLNNEKEIMKLKLKQAQHDSEMSSMIREKELLANNVVKMESLMEKYSNQCKISENERIKLHHDMKNAEQQIIKQNKIISTLEGMKSQLLSDIKDLTKKIENQNNELSSHEEKEASSQSLITDIKNKLSQQIDISSGAIADRKHFCQQYKEIKESRDQLKMKVDILDSYVNELNASQQSHEVELENWKRKWNSLDLKNKTLTSKLAQEESNNTALKNELKHLEEQIRSLLHSVGSKENEICVLQSKLLHATEECMALGTQSQQLKKLIASLETKLQISENAVLREQELYSTLESTTKMLHLEILRLTGEKNTLMTKVNDLQKLKDSFMYAKEELLKERNKNSALELEIQRPLNVHRWRILNGIDPEKYEILENYQVSQKQLLKKCIEVEKRDKKISSMNKLVTQLKNITTKQKDIEEEQVKVINQSQVIKEKNDKIKALTFEINMNETYMSSYQAEISRLKEELRKLKVKQFFKEKRKISPTIG